MFNPGAVGKAEITTAEKSLAFIQIIPCYQRVWSEGETLLECEWFSVCTSRLSLR